MPVSIVEHDENVDKLIEKAKNRAALLGHARSDQRKGDDIIARRDRSESRLLLQLVSALQASRKREQELERYRSAATNI